MPNETEPLTIEEIKKKCFGEWVIVKVVERDATGQPLKARVVSHGVQRYKLRDNIEDKEICIFYAGSIPKEGYVAMF